MVTDFGSVYCNNTVSLRRTPLCSACASLLRKKVEDSLSCFVEAEANNNEPAKAVSIKAPKAVQRRRPSLFECVIFVSAAQLKLQDLLCNYLLEIMRGFRRFAAPRWDRPYVSGGNAAYLLCDGDIDGQRVT
mmetsp:Transcript_6539/g.11614  ORF Transcript_6539/g.11614 Transcript_6539/m.11614 type:complete len:132 (-) Transcript_6539:36-431(-)